MSASALTGTDAAVDEPLLNLRDRRVLRYAVGSVLGMALALGIGWPLSFISVVLALGFLASPDPRPTLIAGVQFVAIVAAACLGGLWLSWRLVPYPLVFLCFAWLSLLWIYYAKESGVPAALLTWILIALLLLPMTALTTPLLASGLAGGLILGALACVLLVWLAHGLFPDPVQSVAATPVASKPAPAALASPEERFKTALASTLVVFPLMATLYTLDASGALVTLIFVGILSMQPAVAKNLKVGIALVMGNALGGLAAIVLYELLVIVPEFGFLVLALLVGGLFFGARVFSDKPSAALYKMGYSTFLLLTGMWSTSGGDVRSMVYTRVFLIMMAAIYVVVAFGVIDRWRSRREA